MAVIHLSILDWVIIVLYFGFVIGLGWYLKRFADTKEDFFLAGRKNSLWVCSIAFVSANLGALEILGWTGGTVKYGMFVSHFYWIGAIPAMLFLGLYMMPFYYSSRIHSIPGYLLLRFDERSRLLNAISFAIMTVLMSGINLYLMALVFHTILGWNWDVCMWISAAAVASYIALGGLLSAILTETLQFFLIWFGLFLVSILGIIDVGGFGGLFEGLPERMTSLWATSGNPGDNPMGVTWYGIAIGLGFVLSFGYWTTDFLIVQRAFTAKDLQTARLTPIVASFFKMALPFIVVVAGLVAFKLSALGQLNLERDAAGNIVNADSALPLLIARYYPAGLVGLGITALLAGFMAGQAGNTSAFNTVFTYDIYKAAIKKDASDEHLVFVGRVITIVGILLSVVTAYVAKTFPTIMDYIQAIFSWVNAPLFATMLLGMFWKRATPTGAFWGLIAGMLTSFLLFLAFKFKWFDCEWYYYLTFMPSSKSLCPAVPSEMTLNLWQAAWAWIVCFVLTVVISLFTEPKSDEELKGLVKGLTPDPDLEDVPLYRRPILWALISLGVLIFLNLYFW